MRLKTLSKDVFVGILAMPDAGGRLTMNIQIKAIVIRGRTRSAPYV